jgi:hypothetical protein
MGYTHYWRTNEKQLDVIKFKQLVISARKLIKEQKECKLCGYDGTKKPTITSNGIGFNGCQANGEDYETFLLTNKPEPFAFCKTALKPYDIIVTACLILYKLTFQNKVIVSSDGNLSEWTPAVNLINNILKYNVNIDFDNNGELLVWIGE